MVEMGMGQENCHGVDLLVRNEREKTFLLFGPQASRVDDDPLRSLIPKNNGVFTERIEVEYFY